MLKLLDFEFSFRANKVAAFFKQRCAMFNYSVKAQSLASLLMTFFLLLLVSSCGKPPSIKEVENIGLGASMRNVLDPVKSRCSKCIYQISSSEFIIENAFSPAYGEASNSIHISGEGNKIRQFEIVYIFSSFVVAQKIYNDFILNDHSAEFNVNEGGMNATCAKVFDSSRNKSKMICNGKKNGNYAVMSSAMH